MRYFISDIKNAMPYIPIAFAIGIFVMCISFLYQYIRFKKIKFAHSVLLMLLFMQVYMMLALALLSRTPADIRIDLVPGGTWDGGLRSEVYIIENIIFFIPYGFLLPASFKRLRSFITIFLICFISSFFIELAQLIFCLGRCQMDDLLANVLGGIIGYILFYISSKFLKIY